MKMVIALLLVLMVFLGCEEGPISPYDEGTDDVYGSSIVEIPGLALSKIAYKEEKYTFTLSITGPNMKPMDFKWQLDESGASFKIDKIPAGSSRLFKGVLYGTDGSTYEGSATVTIYSGKVAHVRLVLTRTGGANVEVIIDEGMVEGGVFAGCWKLKGIVNDIDLSKYTFVISKYNGKRFYGYIKEGDNNVGGLSGADLNGKVIARLSLKNGLNARLQCSVASGAKEFKGVIIPTDGSKESPVVGSKIECHPNGMFSGCWKLHGTINDIEMSKFSMEIKQYKGKHFYGYIKEEKGKIVGKFKGEEVNGEFTIKGFNLKPAYNVSACLKGVIAPSMRAFKSIVHSMDGSKKIGHLGGLSIECKKVVPPPPPPSPQPPSGVLTGCWELKGAMDEIPLSRFTLEIPPHTYSFRGYIKEDDKKIGKFHGAYKGKIIGTFFLPSPYNIDTRFTGGISSTGEYFKGVLVPSDGSSQSFTVEGHKINCYGDSPPACIKDTLGVIGGIGCRETENWIQHASDWCQEHGRKLTKYEFISQCDNKKHPNLYKAICFECCE